MLYPETALRGVLLFIFLWFAFWGVVYAGRAGWILLKLTLFVFSNFSKILFYNACIFVNNSCIGK